MADSVNGGAQVEGTEGSVRTDADTPADQYEDLFQITAERLIDLVADLTEAIAARPKLSAAIFAAAVGAMVGFALAGRPRRRRRTMFEALRQRSDRAKKGTVAPAADYAQLVQAGLKLLENPLVRAFILRAVTRRLTKTFR